MLPRLIFWLFVGLHLWKVVQTMLYAEELERAKREKTNLAAWQGPPRILLAATLYLSGFRYARLPYLWLGLAAVMVVAGVFALTVAAGMRRLGENGAALVPDEQIPMWAARRRRAVIVQVAVVALWTYAWQDVVAPLWPAP